MGLRKKILVLLSSILVSCCFFWLFVMPAYSGYITVSTEQGGWIPNCQSWVNSGIPIVNAPDNVVITSINVWLGGLHFSESDLEIDLKDDNSSRNVTLWNREGISMYYGGDLSYSKLVTGITAFNGMPVNDTWRLWAYDYVCACPPGWDPCPSAEGAVPAWEMTAFYEVDSDGDGIPDNIDADDDGDGMPDVWETTYGLDPHTNDADGDKDGDGLTNLEEYQIGTRPDLTDTDYDGMNDHWEFTNRLWPTDPLDASQDLDGDVLTNLQEYLLGTDPNRADTDGDGIPDYYENFYQRFGILDPLNSSDAAMYSDGYGMTYLMEYQRGTDPLKEDSDGDGLPDGWEVKYGFNPLSIPNLPPEMQDGATDYDHDGLSAMEEFYLGTNPNNSDTDGDGMPDGWEVNNGLNPLVNDAYLDPDGDGRVNVLEYQQGTNPQAPDGTFTIAATASSGGSITPSSTTLNYGGSQMYTISPQTGYHIVDVTVDGVSQGAINNYTFSNVTANHTIAASFAIDTFVISTASGTGGTITPTSTTVNYGSSQIYTITPAANYFIVDVKVDGVSQGPITSYTFANVTSSHTIEAIFAPESFVVNSPNGGEVWQEYMTQTISWSYAGDAGTEVRIDLFKGGLLYFNIATTAIGSAGNGSYTWLIPSNLSGINGYQIRVTSTTKSWFADTSDNSFTINPLPTLTVTSPNGGERLQPSTAHTITWSYTSDPGANVKIDLLKNGALYSTIATVPVGSGGSGSYSWTVPDNLDPQGSYQVRVSSVSYSFCTDTSNSYFYVDPPIKVTSPNGGEVWLKGTTQIINWTYVGDPGTDVWINLIENGVPKSTIATVSAGSGGSGSYNWTIPEYLSVGNNYQLTVTSTTKSNYTDSSDNTFTINPYPTVTVSSPNVGEVWQGGTTRTISWNYTGAPVANVKIDLLTYGLPDITIATVPVGSGGSGSYSWSVPVNLDPWGSYQIRISSVAYGNCTDTSNGYFRIDPPIKITSPAYGVTWQAGTTQTIGWTYAGNPGTSVTIDLLRNGMYFSTIASGVGIGSGGSGTYNWAIPANLNGWAYEIRVTSTSDSTYLDKVGVSINPTNITVTSPNGGEVLQQGTTQNISWSYVGDPGTTVTIDLLKNGVYQYAIASGINIGSGGNGSYAWSVPANLNGADYQIRVTSTADSTFTDTSNIYFTIAPPATITFTAPNGAEAWETGTTQTITWTYVNNVGTNVAIDLLKNGAYQYTIASSADIGTGGSGSYTWSVPGNLNGADYKIRVTETMSGANDISNNNFAIGPVSTVSTVMAGTTSYDWLVGVADINNIIYGLDDSDWIEGGPGDDIIDGGAGEDYLLGGAGNDTYLFGPGSGWDVIEDGDLTPGNIDTIKIEALPAYVMVAQGGYDLNIAIIGTNDMVTVNYWFLDDSYKVERVEFSDGTIWGVAELAAAAGY